MISMTRNFKTGFSSGNAILKILSNTIVFLFPNVKIENNGSFTGFNPLKNKIKFNALMK